MPKDKARAGSEKSARTSDTTRPPARISAFMNQKGGVGKTTTVVNLAAAIAESGHTVLVIDLDPQAHATLHLGVEPDSLERSVYDVLLEPESCPDTLIDARERLCLLPSIVDLAAVETEIAAHSDRQNRLSRALATLAGRFDYILIDCPPSLGLLTLNGLAAAQEVVVPMQAHFLALQGVGKLLETVRLVGHSVNPGLRVAGVVLCMHDDNTRHTREVVADLEGFFESSRGTDVPWSDALVYRPAIRRNIKVAESPSFGQTIFEYARWCAGALDYAHVADAYIKQRLTEDASAPTLAPTPPAAAAPPAEPAAQTTDPMPADDTGAVEPQIVIRESAGQTSGRLTA